MNDFDQVAADFVPTIEELEASFERAMQEGMQLLELARDELRTIQDADAELEGGEYIGTAMLTRSSAAHRLRGIRRMLAKAQIDLIGDWDDRLAAAARIREQLEQAQRSDAPWKNAA